MSAHTPDLLDAIIGATRRRVEMERAAVSIEQLRSSAASSSSRRGLREALVQGGGMNVIAECKRRSPSRGILRTQYDPAQIAAGYERAGAAAISVLTEPAFFDGSLDHLTAVRRSVGLPVLRKDFTIDPFQIWQSRAAGADAVLLIVAALDDEQLLSLIDESRQAGVDALVEVHDEDELGRALSAGADLVGVNNRDLRTLAVDVETSCRLAPAIPSHVVAVAESGLRTAADLIALTGVGYRGFLIGERFMNEADPAAALRALLDHTDRAEGPLPCA
jgi:indole-3-glycerol phosphate synthase